MGGWEGEGRFSQLGLGRLKLWHVLKKPRQFSKSFSIIIIREAITVKLVVI